MPYVTSWERIATERGYAAGEAKGMEHGLAAGEVTARQDILLRLLEGKFSVVDSERAAVIACRDVDRLTAAIDRVMDAGSVSDVIACVSGRTDTSDDA